MILVVLRRSLSSALSCRQRTTSRCYSSGNGSDEFEWMATEKNRSRVMRHVMRENSRTADALAHTLPLQARLQEEMIGRLEVGGSTVPERVGGFVYFTKRVPGVNFPLHCRRPDTITDCDAEVSEEEVEVLLDPNVEIAAHGASDWQIGMLKVSPDQQMLAYTVDMHGDEVFTGYVKDLESGQTVTADWLCNTSSVEFACGSLYFTGVDPIMRRPNTVWRVRVDRGPVFTTTPELVHAECDEALFIDIGRTKDGKFLTVSAQSKSTSEVYTVDASDETAVVRLLRRREAGVQYFVDHAEDTFYVISNRSLTTGDEDSDNHEYRLFTFRPGEDADWQPVIFECEGEEQRKGREESAYVTIEDMDVSGGHCVLYERHNGLPRIRVFSRDAPHRYHYVPLPAGMRVCWVRAGLNEDFHARSVRFFLSSPLVPEQVFDYCLVSERLSEIHTETVPGQPVFDAADYTCYQLQATSTEGTAVPVTVIHARSLKFDGENPLLLHGYGAYGVSFNTDFHVEWLPLLHRGWVIAVAHTRGGGELGRQWYLDGRQLQKRNTFDDFIAVADHLCSIGLTQPRRMAACTESAGGLIAGYVANNRPELFKALIMRVPFVDILNTMLDDTLPLTKHEYDEWGNPRDAVSCDYIRSYAPYENISQQAYPDVLVTGAMNDARINYWEPVKYAARLRNACQRAGRADTQILLSMSEVDGHAGPSSRFEHLSEIAFQYAFVFDRLGEVND